MKQFATPFAVKGTIEELKEIEKSLLKLGYYRKDEYCNAIRYIASGSLNTPVDELCLYSVLSNDPRIASREIIQYSKQNEELILALAAMVEGVKVYPGEYIVMVGNYGSRILKIGNIYKVLKLQDDGKQNYEDQDDNTFFTLEHDNNQGIAGYLSPPRSDFRKATKEEIIQHFNQKNMSDTSGRSTGQDISQLMAKSTVKKIIGWNVKPGIDRIAALKSIGWEKTIAGEKNIAARGYELIHQGICYKDAERLGVLTALFIPVYEQGSRSISIGGRTFEFDKDTVGYSYNGKIYRLTKSDIVSLIDLYNSKFTIATIPYCIKTLAFGCDGQISIEMLDIVKIFNELNKD